MKWDQLGVTNVLLLIIAVLMLALVAQQPRNSRAPYKKTPHLSEMGAAPAPTMQNPHAHTQMPAAPAESDFNFKNMVFAALACPADPTITLADFGCEGDEADKRRTFVKNIGDQGLAPRQMFDAIIDAFGEEALTDEAREIRRNNRAGN